MDISGVKSIIVDIEGTTTSISFVKETLFPFAKSNLEDFINTKWETLQEERKLLKEQAKKDIEDKLDGAVIIDDDENEKNSLIKNVCWQMENDRKTGALKRLQGLIWEKGYADGSYKGHVYDDVAEALKEWKSGDRSLYVYSSGSVDAQKLLFKHSTAGDLLDLFAGYFDTSVGAKTEKSSYEKIVSEIGKAAEEILFLTDVVKEAEAARSAGLQVCLVVREGNAPLSAEDTATYPNIQSFAEVLVTRPTKRSKREEPETTEATDKVVASEEKMDAETAAPAEPETKDEPMEAETKEVEEKPVEEPCDKKEEAAKDEPMESEKVNGDDKKEETEIIPVEKVAEETSESTEKKEEVEVKPDQNGSASVAELKESETKSDLNGAADEEKKTELNGKDAETKAEELVKPEVNGTDSEVKKPEISETKSNGVEKPAEVTEPNGGTNGKANGTTELAKEENCTNGADAEIAEIKTKSVETLATAEVEVKAKVVDTSATPEVEVAAE